MIIGQDTVYKTKREGMGITTDDKRVYSYPATGCVCQLKQLPAGVSYSRPCCFFDGLLHALCVGGTLLYCANSL
jgi:hypothetical protein